MKINEVCAQCVYDKQAARTNNQEYLQEIKSIIDHRNPEDTSPYLVYQFNQIYRKYFGETQSFREEKKKYNDLVLSMENSIRKKIDKSQDPLSTALLFSRVGNYIDFGAMTEVNESQFMELLEKPVFSEKDRKTIQSFRRECAKARSFLLLADNCGEIVLDKLLMEQLRKEYPHMSLYVMVRGGEVLNEVTIEDARYVGIHKVAKIISNGTSIAGTFYDKITEEAKNGIDHADVILSKGQGNYETISKQNRHIFYSLLCKCDLFTERFEVPKYTGIFVEERE